MEDAVSPFCRANHPRWATTIQGVTGADVRSAMSSPRSNTSAYDFTTETFPRCCAGAFGGNKRRVAVITLTPNLL